MSVRTEFEDPDINGRSRKKKDIKNASLSGVMMTISTIGKRLGKKKMVARQCSKRGGEMELMMMSEEGRLEIRGRATIFLSGFITV